MEVKRERNCKEIIQAALQEMRNVGYSHRSLTKYIQEWYRLQEYLISNKLDEINFDNCQKFFKDCYDIKKIEGLSTKDRYRLRFITVLLAYAQNDVLVLHRRSKTTTHAHQELLEAFKNERRRFGLSQSTLNTYDRYGGHFLDYASKFGEPSALTPSLMLDYCNSCAGNSTSTMHNRLSIIRVFARYLYSEGMTKQDLSTVVPNVPYHHMMRPPASYSTEEVQKILNAVDRESPLGKRNYAMLLMASALGLRSSDIRGLVFPELQWEKNTISLVMKKTGKPLILPLLAPVGEAIIDYLRHGRPHINSDVVFLTHEIPYRPLTPSGLSSVVRNYICKAGVAHKPSVGYGPHSLRHFLASSLLEQNIPLPIISEVLGHSDSRTTEIYLSIDIPHLHECSLEVPEFEWNRNKEVL